MSDSVRLLIIEDDPIDAELMVRELKRAGFVPQWVRVETEEEYVAALEDNPEIILSDSKLPLFDGFEALDILKKKNLDIPFILVSGRLGEDVAVDAMKRGACDYLLKDRLTRLGEAVRRALDERRVREERTWAIGALQQSEERYRLVSETSSDYVYSLRVGEDGWLNCEWITEPFKRITGYDASEINEIGWLSLYHHDDQPVAREHQEILKTGRPDSVDLRVVCSNSKIRWMRVYERPVFSESSSDRVERIYGAAQDITVQKQLEEQLLQSRKMEAIGQLAGGVAHDFNNLLTVICGYGELLRKQPGLGEDACEYTDEILEAARRASQLTRQLLAFGRRQSLQARVVNLNVIISDLQKLLRRLIGEDVELHIEYCSPPPVIKVDPGQLEQVLMNLVVNARDAMPKGGTLTIATSNVKLEKSNPFAIVAREDSSHVMLSVSDTGSGMDEEIAARVFEPFFTTKELGKGTGLGLAMVYGIVTQSGGEISLETAPGKGSTFRVFLPKTDSQPEADVKSGESTGVNERGSETILVLEDERSLRTLMRQVLRQQGHTVIDTGDPEEAITLCRQHAGDIALFITDMVLPRLSGTQVAEKIVGIQPGVRIIYTSGYPEKNQIPTELRPFGTVFLEKPFTAESLVRQVRAVLDSKPD